MEFLKRSAMGRHNCDFTAEETRVLKGIYLHLRYNKTVLNISDIRETNETVSWEYTMENMHIHTSFQGFLSLGRLVIYTGG